MYVKIDSRFLLIIGVLLDIIGTIIIAFSILLSKEHLTNINDLLVLEEELQAQLDWEWNLTFIGIILVFLGFIFIFTEMIFSKFIWKSD